MLLLLVGMMLRLLLTPYRVLGAHAGIGRGRHPALVSNLPIDAMKTFGHDFGHTVLDTGRGENWAPPIFPRLRCLYLGKCGISRGRV